MCARKSIMLAPKCAYTGHPDPALIGAVRLPEWWGLPSSSGSSSHRWPVQLRGVARRGPSRSVAHTGDEVSPPGCLVIVGEPTPATCLPCPPLWFGGPTVRCVSRLDSGRGSYPTKFATCPGVPFGIFSPRPLRRFSLPPAGEGRVEGNRAAFLPPPLRGRAGWGVAVRRFNRGNRNPLALVWGSEVCPCAVA